MKNNLNGNGLKREIGLFSATVIVIANMVGTGIFTTSGFIMEELKDPQALMLCWLLGGAFALSGALCYGELGSRFPKAGGEYVFLSSSFGKPMGFLSGWISLIVGFSAPVAAAAIAFSSYFLKGISIQPETGIDFSIGSIHVVLLSKSDILAIFVILIFSFIHYHSLKIGTGVQNILTLFKIALLTSFIAAGFYLGNGNTDHFSSVPISQSFDPEKFAVSMIFISFAFSGWNAAAYLGGEIEKPRRNIPLALFAGTVIVTAFYLILNCLYIYALSPAEMSGVLEVGGMCALSLFGDHAGRYFNAAVSLGILSVLSAMIMAGPRVYYAMSRDHVFFPSFGRLNAKRKTPAASIFLQAGIAVFMVLTASYNTLLIYIGFTLSLFAMLTVIGLILIRVKDKISEDHYKTFGYPVTPLLFIIGNLWIIIFSIKSKPAAPLFGIATILIGIFFYWHFEKKRIN